MNLQGALEKTIVAIPSVNGGALLARMLPTLNIPSRCIVVLDQASTDDTDAVCARHGVELVQLGRAYTYTEACNEAAEIAARRGCTFLFVGNNDITFTTAVVEELLAELIADPGLGIVAPAQVMVIGSQEPEQIAYRVFWDLEHVEFSHDFLRPPAGTRRLEADYCELTFAGLRLSTIAEVGFLDDAFGFYFEDADFGFRLRAAGFSCAYLPRSQIRHWLNSTVSQQPTGFKARYNERNRALFAQKHLGHRVSHADHNSSASNSWNIINKNLHPYLRRHGLLGSDARELIFSHPGSAPFDYLFTVWETSKIPEAWKPFRESYEIVLTTSPWGLGVLEAGDFKRVHYAPLGVETDMFHPWGPVQRFAAGTTFLWFASNQHRKGLDIMLDAWRTFRVDRPGCLLVIVGQGLRNALPTPPLIHVTDGFRVSEYPTDAMVSLEPSEPVDEETLARIYRSVDFTVCTSRAEGFGFVVAESLACGTPAIFGDYGATAEFVVPGALTFGGRPATADYSDKGFWDVGSWWEPSSDDVAARMREAAEMSPDDHARLSEAGVRLIRHRFTWRNTCFRIREALIREGQPVSPPRLTRGVHLGQAGGTLARFSARTSRRVAIVADHLATKIERHGLRDALASTGSTFIRPYLSKRLNWLWRKLRRRPPKRKPPPRSSPRPIAGTRDGTLFIGYAEGGLGLGQAFRAMLAAARLAGIPFAIYPLRLGISTRLIGAYMPERYDETHIYPINVIAVAGDQLPDVVASLDRTTIERSYNVFSTYWELPRAPEAWRAGLRDVDEIWAPNHFIADAYRHIFDGTITVMPPAMEETGDSGVPRARFGLDEGVFYFMFSFDFFSSAHRKNPLGVIEAFRTAFPSSERVGLVIKSIGPAESYPAVEEAMNAAVARDGRLIRMRQQLSRADTLGLIRACDAYMSLHRAEGFGLGMAEALSFGRIVIGTDYSGNTDFLTPETGYPVPYRLRPIEAHEYPFADGQHWAEPDIPAAAAIMRHVVENRDEAAGRAARGRALVRELYGYERTGRAMRERLAAIGAGLASRPG